MRFVFEFGVNRGFFAGYGSKCAKSAVYFKKPDNVFAAVFAAEAICGAYL